MVQKCSGCGRVVQRRCGNSDVTDAEVLAAVKEIMRHPYGRREYYLLKRKLAMPEDRFCNLIDALLDRGMITVRKSKHAHSYLEYELTAVAADHYLRGRLPGQESG